MLVARELAVSPDPLPIARRLAAAGRRRVALLHASDPAAARDPGCSYVAADPDRRSARLDPLADDPEFAGARGTHAAAPRWIGVVPYECRRGLERPGWGLAHAKEAAPDLRPPALLSAPEWHRYPAVVAIDHRAGRVQVVGVDRAAVDRLAEVVLGRPASPAPPLALEVADDEPLARHAERIAAAKELIARGDLYQVNLARRLRVRVVGGDSLSLYMNLARRAPTAFGAYLELDGGTRVVSTSPELLLRAEAAPESDGVSRAFGALFTAPIKGTRPRGIDAPSDAALIDELDRDPKERAELTMILDVERHDLGRIAEIGSVRVIAGPEVVTHRTIHHRVAWLRARAKRGVSREEVLLSMLPSGSVTGAPKVRAMEVIAALEPRRRGLYTGGLGFVAHDGGLTLAMAIRTAVLRDGEGEYWTGGGIVADSDPAREVEETRWKAIQLQRAADGAR